MEGEKKERKKEMGKRESFVRERERENVDHHPLGRP